MPASGQGARVRETSARQTGAFDIVGDTDDLFYDAARKQLQVSGGEGLSRSPVSRRSASRQPEGGDSRVRGAL